ncbi:MAG: hypothetical protein ABW131_02360, partial [Candidatus Sedimenticola sp. 6PFRAG5]
MSLKKRQARREARSLVIPNEQRATPNGDFSGATRRAEAIFPLSGVISRLCMRIHCTPSALLSKKMASAGIIQLVLTGT